MNMQAKMQSSYYDYIPLFVFLSALLDVRPNSAMSICNGWPVGRGQWEDDLQSGHGVEQWKDGSVFEGQFRAGAKDEPFPYSKCPIKRTGGSTR